MFQKGRASLWDDGGHWLEHTDSHRASAHHSNRNVRSRRRRLSVISLVHESYKLLVVSTHGRCILIREISSCPFVTRRRAFKPKSQEPVVNTSGAPESPSKCLNCRYIQSLHGEFCTQGIKDSVFEASRFQKFRRVH